MKIAIIGYGNLGRGVENAVRLQPDMELVGVFTRRNPETVETAGAPVYSVADIDRFEIDVAVLCGGSATDLMHQGPEFAARFNVVDSFDTHAKIPEHFADMERVSRENDTLSMISTGWDPGLFSIQRLIAEAVLPQGETFTFWGKGVSQGHSDAVRRIEGVANAIQYTIPKEEALEAARAGRGQNLTTGDKHLRECFVVAEEGADLEKIREEIVTMPNYFSDYETIVNFITAEELARDHRGMPHGGIVLRRGETADGVNHVYEFGLDLDSNPQFTASVNVACARAVYRAYQEGTRGCVTMFDLPLAYLSPKSGEELRKELL